MIATIEEFDIEKILSVETLSRENIAFLKKSVYSVKENREDFDKYIDSLRSAIKKERDSSRHKDLLLLLGIALWIVGDIKEASELLHEVRARKIGSYYLAKCFQELGDYDQALEYFEKSQKADGDEFDIGMDIAETKRMAGNVSDALKIIKHFSHAYADNAELHYQWGHCLEDQGKYQEAVTHYEKAIQIDPGHPKALFRMAFNYDLEGEDDKAIEFYEKCTILRPAYKNAFVNLGVLYEDKGDYDDAVLCFETVLDVEPTHKRAALLLRDAKASLDMYYDEEISKKQGKECEVLNIPISDFELSVRSRNCLEKMNIRTLKDLTRITEPDLLTFKNFGETSLNEIKAILAQKGLQLGQAYESDEEKND